MAVNIDPLLTDVHTSSANITLTNIWQKQLPKMSSVQFVMRKVHDPVASLGIQIDPPPGTALEDDRKIATEMMGRPSGLRANRLIQPHHITHNNGPVA